MSFCKYLVAKLLAAEERCPVAAGEERPVSRVLSALGLDETSSAFATLVHTRDDSRHRVAVEHELLETVKSYHGGVLSREEGDMVRKLFQQRALSPPLVS